MGAPGEKPASSGERDEAQARRDDLEATGLDRYLDMEWAEHLRETGRIPIVISLADGENHQEIEEALRGFLQAIGLEVFSADPPIVGSWIRRLMGSAMRSELPTANQVAAILERAAALRAVDQLQADVDLKVAEAVSKLMSELDKEENAAFLLGAILYVKVGTVHSARTLTPEQMRALSRDPELLGDPATILNRLADFSRHPEGLPQHCLCGEGVRCWVHSPLPSDTAS